MEQEIAGELGYTAALEHAKTKQYAEHDKDYVKLYQEKRHKMGKPIKGQHAYRISRAANPHLKNKPSPLRNVTTKLEGGRRKYRKRKTRRRRKTRRKTKRKRKTRRKTRRRR